MFVCFNMYHHLSQAALGYCEGKRQGDEKVKVKYDGYSYEVLKSEVRERKTNRNSDNNTFS